MSKLTRQTLQQFGATVNVASEIGEFGSGATGSPVYTGTLSVIQSLAAWSRGWAAETIANNRPFLEDMNAVDYVFGYELCYILQMGIPEWDAGTTYYTNSIVQSGGILYQSLVDSNLNNAVGSNANWRQFTSAAPYVKASEIQSSGTSGQTSNSTGSWNTVILNTKDNDSNSIATLASNLITLPAGTYEVFARVPAISGITGQSRLYNITNSSVLILGSNVFSTRVLGYPDSQSDSVIQGQFSLSASSQIALQAYASSNNSGYGVWGGDLGASINLYSVIELRKVL